MKIQVKQTDWRIIVRAVEGRQVIGELVAERLDVYVLQEDRYEIWNEAADMCLGGDHEGSQYLVEILRRLERCEEAAANVQRMVGLQARDDLDWFVIRKVEFYGVTQREVGEAAPRMYRAAAITAARRGGALIANACFAHQGALENPRLGAWVWKHPEFRRDMAIVGPVAFHRAQLALPAANRERAP